MVGIPFQVYASLNPLGATAWSPAYVVDEAREKLRGNAPMYQSNASLHLDLLDSILVFAISGED